MKRTSTATVLCFLLAGCGDDSSKTSTPPAPLPDVAADVASGGETATPEDVGVIDAGGIPPCAFAPPVGAKCNPYPGCKASGCPEDEVCTVVIKGDLKRVECHAPGEAPAGGACDHDKGPFCQEGVCVEGECRLFCNDNADCPENGTCTNMAGVPGKPTVCSGAKAGCSPVDPTSCASPLACYWQNIGSDCLETKQAGGQGAECDCASCCDAGFACVVNEGKKMCGQTCLMEGEAEPLCNTVCAGLAVKKLDLVYGACVPGGPPPPPPDPCDILKQDCADGGKACYNTSQGDVCLQKGGLQAGSPCDSANDCAPGLACVASKCYIVCDPNDVTHAACQTGINAQCPKLQGSTGGYCDE